MEVSFITNPRCNEGPNLVPRRSSRKSKCQGRKPSVHAGYKIILHESRAFARVASYSDPGNKCNNECSEDKHQACHATNSRKILPLHPSTLDSLDSRLDRLSDRVGVLWCTTVGATVECCGTRQSQSTGVEQVKMAAVVGTWAFSFEAVELISGRLRAGSGCVDALESGINGKISNREFGSIS